MFEYQCLIICEVDLPFVISPSTSKNLLQSDMSALHLMQRGACDPLERAKYHLPQCP